MKSHAPRRTRTSLTLAAAMALSLACPSIPAQDPAKPPAVPVPAVDADVIYLRGPDNKLVPVLVNGTMREYLDWLEKRKAAPAEAVPAFGISSLSLSGTADEDRASLSVKIAVQVHKEGWITVPLGLTEAFLSPEIRYEGPGEHSAGDFDPKNGYTWRLKGQTPGDKPHVLTLSVVVPLRKGPLSRRLLLTLPTAAASSLELRASKAVGVTPAMERATLQVQAEQAASKVTGLGLGSRVDLAWQLQPESAPAQVSLETTTALLATIVDGQTLSLDATLSVKALRGTIDQLRIQVPPGFSREDDARFQLLVDGEESSDLRTDPADKLAVIVPLKKTTAGPLQIKWRGTRRLVPGAPVNVEGPRVDRTDLHSGFLALTMIGDFVPRPQLEADPTVERVSPASLPPLLREANVTSAYRILRQPYHLPLVLQKVEPYATVEPQVWLHAGSGTLDLDASWKVQVFRGSISSLRIDWPGREPGRWTLEPLDPPALVESVEEDPKGLLVRLVEPTKGVFQLRLKARRTTPAETALTLTLPSLSGLRSSPAELLLTTADNLHAEVRTPAGVVVAPLPAQATPRRPPPAEAQKFQSVLYRFDAEPAFGLSLVPHAREVLGRSVVRVTARGGRLNVAQTLELDVRYERLSQLRIPLSEALLAEQVRVFFRNAELTPRVSREDGRSWLVVPLDQPRLGKLDLEARYRLEDPLARPGAETARVTLPILSPEGVALSETRVEWGAASHEARLEARPWIKQPGVDGATVWTAAGVQTRIDLTLTPAVNPSLRGAIASRALVRIRIDGRGQLVGLTQYRLSGAFSNLHWSLPENTRLTGVWWNTAPLEPAIRREGRRMECELSGLEIPSRIAATDHLLTIAWQLPGTSLHRLADLRELPCPLLSDVSLRESLWDIEIPASHYLLSDPAGFDSEQRWVFQGLGWWRVPNRSPAGLIEWIKAGDGPELPEFSAGGNRYQFARLGPATELPLLSMSGSGVVLLGAGVFALLGLLLLQSSRTRNVATLLAAAVVAAAAGVVWPSTTLLLLQPAAAGACLAVLFTMLQHLLRRRRPDVMSVASASSFPVPPGSSIREQPIPIGSTENTQVRPPPRESVPVASESGSRA